MNENYRNNYNDEMEINLVDLMFYLLKHWKSLLIVTILGVLLGVGIWKVKGASPDKGAAVDELLESEEDMNVVAEQLKIAPDVIRNMELAYQYRGLYEGQINYNQNSILMKLDPNEVYTGTLRYYVSAGDNTELLSLLYQNMISKREFIHKIKESASIDCEEQYVRELINCSLSGSDAPIISIDGTETVPQSVLISYSVVYSNTEVCEKVLQIIREEAAALQAECQEKYGEYTQETVFDGVQFVADNSRLDKQKSDIDVMNACLTNITKLETNFTDEEMAYYETVYLGRDEEDILDKEEVEEEVEQTVPAKSSVAKWLLIGIMLGIVCWGGFYLVKYLFDKRVKYAEEVSNYYGLHLIGRYKPEDSKLKGIDKLQEQIVNRNMGSNSREYIASAMNILDEKTLLLIGDLKDQDVETFVKGLIEKCSKAEYGNLMQNDSEALERAKDKAGVILCVHKGKTTHTEIQRELEICRLQNICVAGAVVVEA